MKKRASLVTAEPATAKRSKSGSRRLASLLWNSQSRAWLAVAVQTDRR
jgi:hypothetical protein